MQSFSENEDILKITYQYWTQTRRSINQFVDKSKLFSDRMKLLKSSEVSLLSWRVLLFHALTTCSARYRMKI